jgi:hypothetical protein
VSDQSRTSFWRRLIRALALHVAAGVLALLALAGVSAAYLVLFGLEVHPIGGRTAAAMLIVTVVALLWLVTALTGLLCHRLLKWPRVTQIPVSAAMLFAAIFAVVAVANHQIQPGEPVSWRTALVTWVVLLPALTVYWWILQVPGLVARVVAYFHIQRTGF